MIAIGSGSMSDTINKGDAIIYKKFDEKTDLEAGDIVVFNRDSMIVIHRIIKKYTIYGEEVYQTKGDANKSADNWVVKKKDIVGTVEMRIPWIAWPSVLINTKY
jgi:signal peptidase